MTQPLKSPAAELAFLYEAPRHEADFKGDVLKGLSSDPKAIPPKYFYDEIGAELFEDITHTPEYYPTQAELSLLDRHAKAIAKRLGEGSVIMEPGSGAGRKVRPLIDAMVDLAGYIAFDISREQLEAVGAQIAGDYPNLTVGAVAGDFTTRAPFEAEECEAFPDSARRIVFFPGSTLGNFEPDEQVALLTLFRKNLRPGDGVLIGVDRIKNAAILDAAYDDAGGATAAFNLNLLVRMKRELGAEVEVGDFRHRAFYNPSLARVEIYLQAVRDTEIVVAGERFALKRGETIHTENSHKFNRARVSKLAEAAGLHLSEVWGEEADGFMLAWLGV